MQAIARPCIVNSVKRASARRRPATQEIFALPLSAWRFRTSAQRTLSTACAFVAGESAPEAAATAIVDKLGEQLSHATPDFLVFFAKGYGNRFQGIGEVLQRRLGGVVVGCSSEGGVLGLQGEQHKDATFAVSALAIAMPGMKVFPFYTRDFDGLPDLRRGTTWVKAMQADSSLSVFACACLEPGQDLHPWLTGFDRIMLSALASSGKLSSLPVRLPTICGGITVGREVYVDGSVYSGGGFGAVFQAPPGGSIDMVMSPGTQPFGPWLRISSVDTATNLVTSIDGEVPVKVLGPLIGAPDGTTPRVGDIMVGVFVPSLPHLQTRDQYQKSTVVAGAALQGRPSCLCRPLLSFDKEGNALLAPLSEGMPYAVGMRFQLHRFSEEAAADDLISRVEQNLENHEQTRPDAVLVSACGTRGLEEDAQSPAQSSLAEAFPGIPLAGFFGNGQIGPVGARTYVFERGMSCLLFRGPSAE